MKKLILVASIFVAGVASAKTVTPKNGEEKTVKVSATTTEKFSKERVVMFDEGTIYYTASCAIQVSTYQPSWGWAEAQAWAALIEQNYCKAKSISF